MDREDVDYMVQRRWIWMFILVCLMIPRGVYSQTAEEGDMAALHAPVESPQTQRAPHLSAVVQLVLRRTNDLRHQEGRPPVDPNPKLTQTAQYFANYMAQTNKYGHTADGSRPGERARKHGDDSCMVSENIAYQYSSTGLTTEELAEAFFEGWKQSAKHRKNMLDADATETGLAVAQSDETSYYYAVQMFGRPSSQRIEFQIVNRSAAAISYEIGSRSFTLPPQYARTHQQCRPAALRFRWPDGAQTPPKQESQTIHPRDGERYTIIQSEAGQFSVQRE